MERKVPFEEGEVYHLYTRGVEKRLIFCSKEDHERFLALLCLCNSGEPVRLKAGRGEPSAMAFETPKGGEKIVDIFAYALMPNHVHLIAKERVAGGISKFMLKLMTAYSMYFNTKYERSGPLFTRPFRSKHVDADDYFRWVFAYVLLNPLDLFQSDWREHGLSDKENAAIFIRSYKYGSFPDYFADARPEGRILERSNLPVDTASLKNLDALLAELARNTESYQEKTFSGEITPPALV